jgi:hypothetical protein
VLIYEKPVELTWRQSVGQSGEIWQLRVGALVAAEVRPSPGCWNSTLGFKQTHETHSTLAAAQTYVETAVLCLLAGVEQVPP